MMCQPPTQRITRSPARSAGLALIVTVLFLAVVALLAVSLAISVRVGLQTARTHTQMLQVREIAQGANDYAIAMLRGAMPPLSATQSWVNAPGMAWRFTGGSWTQQPLYSLATPIVGITNRYPNSTEVLTSQGINLNEQLFLTGESAQYYYWIITNNFSYIGIQSYDPTNSALSVMTTNFYTQRYGVPILAGWVNLGPDGRPSGYYGPGSLNYFSNYHITNINPVTVRWAVWIDAENCKVNLNTTGYRSPANLDSSTPREIDLRALDVPFSNATTSQLAALASQPLSTPEEFRLYSGSWPGTSANDFKRNKFHLSVHGAGDNLTAFGTNRTVLNGLTMAATNQLADTRYASLLYPDVITDPNRLSLAGKYGAFGAAQIVANILEYQTPYTPSNAPLGSANRDTDEIPLWYCGLKKGPLIDAVIVHVATNQTAETNLQVHAFVDVRLVNGYDANRGTNWVLKVEPASIEVKFDDSTSTQASPQMIPVSEQTYVLSKGVDANRFGLLGATSSSALDLGPSQPIYDYSLTLTNSPGTNIAPRVTEVVVKLKRVRLLMADNPAAIVDWLGPVDVSNQVGTNGLIFRAGGAGDIVPFVANSSPRFVSTSDDPTNFLPIALVKQDPRTRTPTGWTGAAGHFASNAVNQLWRNWVVYPASNVNSQSEMSYDSRLSPTVFGLLADSRSGIFGVSHSNLNERFAEAPFQSVGELGYIHTGYPWRTLRLRSVVPHTTNVADTAEADYLLTAPYRGIGDPNAGYQGVESNAAPDWLLLDMFTANSNSIVAGRLNINGTVFGERLYAPHYVSSRTGSDGRGHFVATTNSVPPRLAPIRALLANSSTNLPHASPMLDTIAGNILSGVFVPNSPYAILGRPPAYLTPGEICEVQGLDYFADSFPATKNQRQQTLRRISELITTRSDTFTVWTAAQIVKERLRGIPTFTEAIPNGERVQEPDGIFDWLWFNPRMSFMTWYDGDGQEDSHGNNFSQDFIIAQVRVQTVVQRYLDDSGRVCFRTLYTRYWSE